jgi:hypothetical protein
MGNIRLFLLILAGGAVFSAIVMALAAFFKRRRWVKYLPALLLFVYMFYAIVRATSSSEGMRGLAYIIMAMLAFGAGLMSVLTAVVIDVLRSIEKRKKMNPEITSEKTTEKESGVLKEAIQDSVFTEESEDSDEKRD